MGWRAQRRLRRAGFASSLSRGKAQHLPFATDSLDEVVSTFPSEYIVAPETLADIQRVLRPGGRLIVLPVAWIRGHKPLARMAAWLFRVTGQSESWEPLFSEKFRSARFVVEEKRITFPSSELVLLIASKVIEEM